MQRHDNIVNKYLFGILVVLTLLAITGCAAQSHHIDTDAVRDEMGNYMIRWEVKPGIPGEVEIYASEHSTHFPSVPAIVEEIDKQVATFVTHNSYDRRFFMLVFNNGQASTIIGARVAATDAMINLRDVGGYLTASSQRVRWESMFRSGDLINLSHRDSLLIDNSAFVSRLVLADHVQLAEHPTLYTPIPTRIIPADFDFEEEIQLAMAKIFEGTMTREKVQDWYEEYYHRLAFDNKQQYRTALLHLLCTDHYPILLSDRLGKDRLGFLIMLVQSILGVSRSDIIREYMLSNELLHPYHIIPNGFTYPIQVQEAITEFFRCRPNYLYNIMATIESEYGSIPDYIEQVIGFDRADQEALRKILLR